MNILFMCVANSARSQMAEGLGKRHFGSSANIESAGSKPTHVNPLAIEAMQEIGIDISQNKSKSWDDLSPEFVASLDFVITLCAEEVCPALITKAKKLHWSLSDPAGDKGSKEQQLQKFREIRDLIQLKLKSFSV